MSKPPTSAEAKPGRNQSVTSIAGPTEYTDIATAFSAEDNESRSDQSTTMRLEYKYLIPNEHLPKLRALIAPFVKADAHNRGAHGYTVHSIYFDSVRLTCYHDKQAGLRARKKIRIRGYNGREESDTVFLEVKQKHGRFTVKNRAPVKYAQIKEFLASGDVERYVRRADAADDARQFLFQVYRSSLRPVILVVYDREAYQSKFDSLRITFDKNLRSSPCSSTDCLFEAGDASYPIPQHFILELKFYGGLPSWVKFTIGTLDLNRRSLSKYGICLGNHKWSRLATASYADG